MDLIRESAGGQTIRFLAGNKVLPYPEEQEGFKWEALNHLLSEKSDKPANHEPESEEASNSDTDSANNPNPSHNANDPLNPETNIVRLQTHRSQRSVLSTSSTNPYTRERFDVEQELATTKSESIVVAPTRTSDGIILVDWYSTDDPENPQNWSGLKKAIVLSQLCAYTMAVYGASSMYVPGEAGVMDAFGVEHAPAALGLAIYVVGYGLGPLLWAPLSEIATVGRNWIYIPTIFLFVILSIPLALVDNFAGLLVLRFLTGFFGSPCLANGGATVSDMYSLLELPLFLSCWTALWFWGPAIGPVIAGFAIQAKGWRWGLWEVVWLAGPILAVYLFAYPETSADTILRRRARRLRALTGRTDIKSQSEVAQANLNVSEVIWDALIKPAEIMIKDPAVLFTNLYTSLTYGIYYTFFEVFPLVYPPIYGFNIGETGLCFLTIGIACLFGVGSLLIYQLWHFIPAVKRNGFPEPEVRLIPALFAVVTLPVGYFMFGWTARPGVHWIVSLIGVVILVTANFILFQSLFVYLPLSYPKYAASLFAANDLCRSLFATACILAGRPLFVNLGIGGGVSLLAGLACLGVFGMFYLWKYGAWLRSKSTFAQG